MNLANNLLKAKICFNNNKSLYGSCVIRLLSPSVCLANINHSIHYQIVY